MFPQAYFAPTYFAPTYFAATAGSFTPDPDVLALMDRVIQVKVDPNAAGGTKTLHGGILRGPYVAVAGLEAVQAHRVAEAETVLSLDGKQVTLIKIRWLFAAPIALDIRHIILWPDGDRGGVIRTDYVAGPSYAPGGNDASETGTPIYWVVPATEALGGFLP